MSASRHVRQDYFFESERRSRARGRAWILALAIFGLVATHLLDRWFFHAFYLGPAGAGQVESKAWYQILRQAGDVRAWIIVSLAIGAHAFWRAYGGSGQRLRLGGVIAITAAPMAAGIAAELFRMILARERPMAGGEYHDHAWRGLFAGVYSGGRWFDLGELGLPSSHAAVAMAGAVACARAFPGTGWVLVPVAIGCSWTRMATGRHYASDVFLGMIIGWAAGAILASFLRRIR
ncbi:MAG: phosphatase PAP2 family protein [Phycisphaerales bacterium]|nr:phosphatase PAP2 family protein [Planctomycetota bacterium]